MQTPKCIVSTTGLRLPMIAAILRCEDRTVYAYGPTVQPVCKVDIQKIFVSANSLGLPGVAAVTRSQDCAVLSYSPARSCIGEMHAPEAFGAAADFRYPIPS